MEIICEEVGLISLRGNEPMSLCTRAANAPREKKMAVRRQYKRRLRLTKKNKKEVSTANVAAKVSQSVPPILAPETLTLTGPQETSIHGKKKQITDIPTPAGVRIYLSDFSEGNLYFIFRG